VLLAEPAQLVTLENTLRFANLHRSAFKDVVSENAINEMVRRLDQPWWDDRAQTRRIIA